MSEQFEKGDVVQLKSGGPHMTVTGKRRGEVICQWFENGDKKASTFPPESLQEAEAGPAMA